jgi:hypothetical protein
MGLDAGNIGHGTKIALAISLQRKQWETSVASCRSALIHSDSRAAVQGLRQCSAQEGAGIIGVATLVPVRWTCSFEIV